MEENKKIRRLGLVPAFSVTMLSMTAFAGPPAIKMDTERVADFPQAGQFGAAALKSDALQRPPIATQFASLAAPAKRRMEDIRQDRIVQLNVDWPLQVGFARAIPKPVVDLRKLHWQATNGGEHVATLKVKSAGAASLRVALQLSGHGRHPGDPGKVALRFLGNDGGVFPHVVPANGAVSWSPVVEGDTLLMEVTLPAGQSPENFSLKIPQLSHLDISPNISTRDMRRLASGAGSKCNDETTCAVDESVISDPVLGPFYQANDAVVRMTFTSKGDTYICTGTLLNNSNVPKRPLLWTSAHCINNDTVASTLTTYWFRDARACNKRSHGDRMVRLSGGARVLHADKARDTALLELNYPAPAGAQYAGWSSEPLQIGEAVIGIHHPGGFVKKYAAGDVEQFSKYKVFGQDLYKVKWFFGAVDDSGSKGSAIFTVDRVGHAIQLRLRGGLRYADATQCTTSGGEAYYSSFADNFENIKRYLIANP